MKIFTLSISMVLVVILSFFSVNSFNSESNPMIGTWVMKSGVYLGPDGKPGYLTPGSTKQMKVINDTHFTTMWQDSIWKENRGFNGGSYTYNNGVYTEYLEYFTITGRIGDTAHFKVEVDGNELSISACDAEGNVNKSGYFQVWERMEGAEN